MTDHQVCKKGHDLTLVGVYTRPDGKEECRACRSASRRKTMGGKGSGRKPQQQTLITAPGEDASRFPGTPQAKEKMAKVRAAKGRHDSPAAIERAIGLMQGLHEIADVLHGSGVAGGLQRVQVVAMLIKGLELGIGPVEAIQGMYFTSEGKIEFNAELMRALVARSGLGIMEVAELNETRCVLNAVRYDAAYRKPGSDERCDLSMEFTYTLADAQRANLIDDSWRKWPRAMLLARCTSEGVRAVFPDVLIGAYAPGERGGTVEEGKISDLMAEAERGAMPVQEPEPTLESTPDPKPEHRPEPMPEPTPPPKTTPKRDTTPKRPPVEPTLTPAAATEPATAPEPAAQAPEPSPVENVAETAAPVVSPPPIATDPNPQANGGTAQLPPMTHQFPHEAPGGGVRVITTAGIEKHQLQRIGDLTTARAGQPKWQELQAAGRAWLGALQPPRRDTVQLTQAEGDALIEHLVETGKRLIDPLPQESEHDRLLNAVLADTVTTHLRDKVVAFIVSSAGCDVITQIELAQFKKYLQEMRNLITDPQVFEHLLEQTLASTPVSA